MHKQISRMFFPAVGFSVFFLSTTLTAAVAPPAIQDIPAIPVQVQPGPVQPSQTGQAQPGQTGQAQTAQTHTNGIASVSPAEALKQSAKLAGQSEFGQAFEMALRAKNLQDPNPLFAVDYLNTLVSIAEMAEAANGEASTGNTELTVRVLNEAVTLIESLMTSPNYDGRNNPESAYFFMLAASKCAEVVLSKSEAAHFSLQICAGNIARNLRTNPHYPADSQESLSGALVGMAKGYAVAGDQPSALQCIAEAAELGFGQFVELATNACMLKLPDQVTLQSHLKQLDAAYQVKLAQWSRVQIDQFKSFTYTLNVADVEGGDLKTDEFDDKILVVDFWATWCPPCREGIPHFVKLQEEFEDEDVQVLGVSMDCPDDPNSAAGTVKKFLKKYRVNYPCGLGTDQTTQDLPGEVKLPTTLFIDRLGNVRYIANGYHDHAKLAAITKALTNEGRHVRTSLQRIRSRIIAD